MDTAHWPQEIVVKPMEEIVTKPSNNSLESRKVRPQKEQALNCPRCNSTNTKFCYYNNYSLSQPRYFCKTCRRYWTEGGSLRNIPVGGGSRKNRRSSTSNSNSNSNSSSSNSSYASGKKMIPDLPPNPLSVPNPNLKIHESSNQDLNLGFSTTSSSSPSPHDFKAITELIQVPNFDKDLQNPPSSSSHQISALELLNGIASTRGLSSFMSMPTTGHHHHHDPSGVYSSSAGFAANLVPDFMKPSLSFSLDHGLAGSNYGGFQGVQEATGKLLFPFQDLKQVSNDDNTNDAHDHQQNRDDQPGDAAGYWNGVIGGGSW